MPDSDEHDDLRARRIAVLRVGGIARGAGSLADVQLRCIAIATTTWIWAILVEATFAATRWSEPDWLTIALVAVVPIGASAWLFLHGRPAAGG